MLCREIDSVVRSVTDSISVDVSNTGDVFNSKYALLKLIQPECLPSFDAWLVLKIENRLMGSSDSKLSTT